MLHSVCRIPVRNLSRQLTFFGVSPDRRLTAMSILWTIIIGFIAGVIAKLVTPGDNEPSGFILTTILGIIGAFVATYLGQAIGWYRADQSAGLIGAIVGAVILLVIWHFISARTGGYDAGPRALARPPRGRLTALRGLAVPEPGGSAAIEGDGALAAATHGEVLAFAVAAVSIAAGRGEADLVAEELGPERADAGHLAVRGVEAAAVAGRRSAALQHLSAGHHHLERHAAAGAERQDAAGERRSRENPHHPAPPRQGLNLGPKPARCARCRAPVSRGSRPRRRGSRDDGSRRRSWRTPHRLPGERRGVSSPDRSPGRRARGRAASPPRPADPPRSSQRRAA